MSLDEKIDRLTKTQIGTLEVLLELRDHILKQNSILEDFLKAMIE